MTRIGRIFTDFLSEYYWNADWADFHGFFIRILLERGLGGFSRIFYQNTIGTRIGQIFTDFLSEYYWNADWADFHGFFIRILLERGLGGFSRIFYQNTIGTRIFMDFFIVIIFTDYNLYQNKKSVHSRSNILIKIRVIRVPIVF
jgi:hypothetical protein